jgi:hypothetical protein
MGMTHLKVIKFECTNFLGYDVLSTGTFLLVFRSSVLPPSSGSKTFIPIYQNAETCKFTIPVV